jgi:hypothetical protein
VYGSAYPAWTHVGHSAVASGQGLATRDVTGRWVRCLPTMRAHDHLAPGDAPR